MLLGQQLNSHEIFKWQAKALIRLRVCAGWSEPLLVAHTTLLEISCHGSFHNLMNLLKYVVYQVSIWQRATMGLSVKRHLNGVPHAKWAFRHWVDCRLGLYAGLAIAWIKVFVHVSRSMYTMATGVRYYKIASTKSQKGQSKFNNGMAMT